MTQARRGPGRPRTEDEDPALPPSAFIAGDDEWPSGVIDADRAVAAGASLSWLRFLQQAAKRVRARRSGPRGWTQERLESRAGVGGNIVSRLENGSGWLSRQTVFPLLDALGVEVTVGPLPPEEPPAETAGQG